MNDPLYHKDEHSKDIAGKNDAINTVKSRL